MNRSMSAASGLEEQDFQDDPGVIPASVLLATIPVGVITYQADGRCSSANVAAVEVLGITRNQLMRQNFRELSSWRDSGLLTHAEAVLRHGHPFDGRLPVMTTSGKELCLEWRLRRIRLDEEAALLVVFEDVTEAERVERALRLTQLSVDKSADMIHWLDSAGRVIYVSDSTCQRLGYSRKELMKMTVFDLNPTITPEAWTDRWTSYRDGGSHDLETVHKTKGGEVFPLELTINQVESDGVTYHFAYSRDITARKKTEEVLCRRLAELEALHGVASSLRTARTRDEAAPIVLDAMLAALETEAGALWLYDADRDELRSVVGRGWLESVTIPPGRPGESLIGNVFTSGQTYVSPDLSLDPLVHQSSRDRTPAGWGGVSAPIRTGEITIGVLLVSMPPGHSITHHHVSLIESLAEMAGSALHRMALHEATVRQLGRLEATRLVHQAISSNTDLSTTLDLLLGHVAAQLRVDAADVLLVNPYTLTLEHAAGRGFRTCAVKRAHMRLEEGLPGRAALERRPVHSLGPAHMRESPQLTALATIEEFVAYYAVPLMVKGQVLGVMEVFHRSPLAAGPDWVGLLETLAGQAAIAIENAQLVEHLQRSNLDLTLAHDATIEGWSRALDLRDGETEGHTLRVTEMAMRVARAVGISDEEMVHLRRGALLHDIGKLGVPDSILLKPGPLSEEEWVVMRRHPQLAYELLMPITYLRPALDLPYCHHERWDGSGYPRGLKGEDIPLTARLFAVVDVWDALRSDRPYRAAWSEARVLEYIRSSAGTQFDPKMAEIFLHVVSQGAGEYWAAG